MSKITKSLHYQKTNGTSGTCALYTSKDDCAGYSTINLEVDGANVYAGLGTSLTADNASGIRIQKNDSSTKYAILKWTQAAVNIDQVDNQTIKINANSGTVASGTLLPMSTMLIMHTVSTTTGYNPGIPTVNGNKAVFQGGRFIYEITQADIEKGSLTISATAATKQTFTLSFGATTNQTYTATVDGVAKAATASATSYTVNYGTTYSVAYTANSATAAYTYTASGSVSGTVTNTTSIPAKTATATLRYYTLTIPATENQSYTLKLATNSSYGGTLPSYTSTATKNAQTLSVPYGTTYSISYTADSGYNPGSAKSGTVNGNTTVSHNAATVATATVTIIQSANQTIHVYTPQKSGGTDHTSSFTCPIGTKYEAEVIAASGYNAGTLNVSGGG